MPFLYEQAFQWYPSFDALGGLLERPNPTAALDLLTKILEQLVKECAWPMHRIHLFGFAQGGSLAAELGIKWWKEHSKVDPSALGSIITICGPLLSYPTLNSLCPTPVFVVDRPAPSESALPPGAMAAFKKGFETVREVLLSGAKSGMPASKDEWEPIMKFWSERLGRRQGEGLYEVMTGR